MRPVRKIDTTLGLSVKKIEHRELVKHVLEEVKREH